MIELSKEELDRLTAEALNPKDVVLPMLSQPVDSVNNKEQSEKTTKQTLIGGSITEDIVNETVSNVIVQKVDAVKIPSYIIECDDTPTIKGCWDAFYGMLQGGDTTVYVKGITGEIRELGSGSGQVLYNVLEQVVHGILGKNFNVYKNSGNGFEKVQKGDISLLRLNL